MYSAYDIYIKGSILQLLKNEKGVYELIWFDIRRYFSTKKYKDKNAYIERSDVREHTYLSS